MPGTINVLADIGIGIGLVFIGDRVWQDNHRFGELISTGLKLRRKLEAAAIDRYASSHPALSHYVNPVRHKFWTTL